MVKLRDQIFRILKKFKDHRCELNLNIKINLIIATKGVEQKGALISEVYILSYTPHGIAAVKFKDYDTPATLYIITDESLEDIYDALVLKTLHML